MINIEKEYETVIKKHHQQNSASSHTKIKTLLSINALHFLIDSDSIVFDSLANVYSKKYDNFSGIYSGLISINIPDIVLSELSNLNIYELSLPIMTESGYIILFLYGHQNEIHPNLENSWNLIYQHAKQDKRNNFFNNWVENIKERTYIKILYN